MAMDIEMDRTNGLLSPHAYLDTEFPSPQLSTKRKREEGSTTLLNGKLNANGISTQGQSIQEMIADLVLVLQR